MTASASLRSFRLTFASVAAEVREARPVRVAIVRSSLFLSDPMSLLSVGVEVRPLIGPSLGLEFLVCPQRVVVAVVEVAGPGLVIGNRTLVSFICCGSGAKKAEGRDAHEDS